MFDARQYGHDLRHGSGVPGRRYEIEVFSDGSLEVQVFGTEARIGGQEVVDHLITTYSDGPESSA